MTGVVLLRQNLSTRSATFNAHDSKSEERHNEVSKLETGLEKRSNQQNVSKMKVSAGCLCWDILQFALVDGAIAFESLSSAASQVYFLSFLKQRIMGLL